MFFNKQTDASATVAPLGFSNKIENAFYFNLMSIIAMFGRVGNLNDELQKIELIIQSYAPERL